VIKKLKEAGVNLRESAHSGKKLKEAIRDKTFVFTGSLDDLSRDQAAERVREKGGKVTSSISSKTDYVVAGIDPGSKYQKALQLGIKILTEKEFIRLLEE
jgi:DNA ligase (NAD+)